ncbi:MAG TPA: hypothetical protein VFE58_13690 [Tepidisphaeraceae bacterium]|jgi:hypothetical protein|nr:hypothetical protein [Tepidisphaeraceae bacterium]
MLADPYINIAATQSPGKNGCYMSLYAYEVCDACEADQYGYLIDGILVSDFVYPAWFEGFWPQFGTQFDYLNKIQQPFQLLPGGFISVYDIQTGAGWTQQAGPAVGRTYSSRAQVGSRRERRRIPRQNWERSRAVNSMLLESAVVSANSPAPPRVSLVPSGSPVRLNTLQRLRNAADLRQKGLQQNAKRIQVAADRVTRMQQFLGQVQLPTEPPNMGTRAAIPIAGKRPLRILSEGDSWFDYPLPPSFGVIYELEKLLGYSIANMAVAGEEVRQMLELTVRQEIVARLSVPQNVRFDAILFSYGF